MRNTILAVLLLDGILVLILTWFVITWFVSIGYYNFPWGLAFFLTTIAVNTFLSLLILILRLLR